MGMHHTALENMTDFSFAIHMALNLMVRQTSCCFHACINLPLRKQFDMSV